MKQSRRTKRMQLHHARRNDNNTSLNMVSLMDIFTILVFFLLVSAADSEILPSPKQISLPQSSSEMNPKENVIIIVSSEEILVQGKRVAAVSTIASRVNPIIPELLSDLIRRTEEKEKTSTANPATATAKNQGVTIMGDKQIPYELLKKIMLTCARANFTNISLAVMKTAAIQVQAS
jgi:biopolymer transport protein TolR